jgi:hypothetical protein
MSMRDDLMQTLCKIIDDARDDVRISPTMVATRVAAHYESEGGRPTEPHLKYGSIEHFKQLARSVLAHRHEPRETAEQRAEGDLFGDLLQDRYPIARKRTDEPQYVKRAFMSHADVLFNVHRMRAVSGVLEQHADALEAWEAARGDRDAG